MDTETTLPGDVRFEFAYRRYRFNIRKHRFLDRLDVIRTWIAWRLGAQYLCAGTGGCGLRCAHPPKTAMGPFCPECHGRVYPVSEVTWAEDVPWLRESS